MDRMFQAPLRMIPMRLMDEKHLRETSSSSVHHEASTINAGCMYSYIRNQHFLYFSSYLYSMTLIRVHHHVLEVVFMLPSRQARFMGEVFSKF